MKIILTEQQFNELMIIEEEKNYFFSFLSDFINNHKNGITKSDYRQLVSKFERAIRRIGVGPIAAMVVGLSVPFITNAFLDAKGTTQDEAVCDEREKTPENTDTETIDYKEADCPSYMYNKASSFHISEDGINHILDYESFRAEPYNATTRERKLGIFTIGYGHKMSKEEYRDWKKHPYKLTEEEARTLFEKDLKDHEKDFIRAMAMLPNVYNNPNLYSQGFVDACISIVYNAGQPNFRKSTLYNSIKGCRIENGFIRKDDYDYLLSLIKTCCAKAKGAENGLKARRNTEYFMAYAGDYNRR